MSNKEKQDKYLDNYDVILSKHFEYLVAKPFSMIIRHIRTKFLLSLYDEFIF